MSWLTVLGILALTVYVTTAVASAISDGIYRHLQQQRATVRERITSHRTTYDNHEEIEHIVGKTIDRKVLIGHSVLYIKDETNQEIEVYLN